jgi:phosphopantetheine--protein transferase-like protein
MENEIKKIYNTLSGGKIIASDNYIISSSHFNSISNDRFSSELNKRGIKWDGRDIVFSDLINKNIENSNSNSSINLNSNNLNIEVKSSVLGLSACQVGIDIQEIKELPDSSDFWEDDFYKSKFTSEEIAYCLTKDNPKQSFSGLYSCKEALIKSDNNLNWENINILHNENGKPIFENYNISISHSGLYSIAIALKVKIDSQENGTNDSKIDLLPNSITNEYVEKTHKSKIKSNLILYLLVFTILIYILFKDFIKFNYQI